MKTVAMKEMKELPFVRQQQILQRLNEDDCIKINQLAKDFNVSHMTIYRDILQLEKSGEAMRVYGGVKAVNKQAARQEEAFSSQGMIPVALQPYCDSTIEERFHVEMEAKQAIAKAAADYVKDGDVIAIDPSTTTLHMCPYLQEKKIIVVTTSVNVALQFASSKNVDVILCGGMLRKSSLSMVGFLVETTLRQIRVNKCFISSHGFAYEQGLTDMTLEESDAKRQFIKSSNEVYVLIDHTKFNKYAPFVVCSVDEITGIITDASTRKLKKGKEIMDQCAAAGCKISYAREKKAAARQA